MITYSCIVAFLNNKDPIDDRAVSCVVGWEPRGFCISSPLLVPYIVKNYDLRTIFFFFSRGFGGYHECESAGYCKML